MVVLVRHMSGEYSAFELLFFRNIVAVAILLPPVLTSGFGLLRTGRFGLHCLRAAFAYLAVLGLFYGIGKLALPDVTALSFTQPLFVVLLAALILKEQVGAARWWALGFGFVGLLVIVRPGFAEIGLATIVVLLSAFSYACANICVKRLMSTDTPRQAVIFFNLLMLPLSLGPALAFWVTPEPMDLLRLVAVGLFGTLAVYAYAQAFAAADASAVMPFDFLRLPMSAGFAFVLFAEAGDLWSWVGSAIIFAGSWGLSRTERRRGGGGGHGRD